MMPHGAADGWVIARIAALLAPRKCDAVLQNGDRRLRPSHGVIFSQYTENPLLRREGRFIFTEGAPFW